jgi:hypothetical protein
MNVLEEHAEKSDKIFPTSSTIICLYVGNQMPTSVSYLSNKQTHLNIWGHVITCHVFPYDDTEIFSALLSVCLFLTL